MGKRIACILVAIFILANNAACSGSPVTLDPNNYVPPKDVTVVYEPSQNPYINIEVKDVRILETVGDPSGTGELRLFVIVSDGLGHSNGLWCPSDHTIPISRGQVVQPCFTGVSVNESLLQNEYYAMVVAIDEDSSNPLSDLGYEAAVGALGAAFGNMIVEGAGIAAAGPEAFIITVGAGVLIGFIGGQAKDWFEKQDIIGVQILRLERAKDWEAGSKFHLTSQDNKLDIEVWINRTSTPDRIVVWQAAPTSPPIIISQEPKVIIVTATSESTTSGSSSSGPALPLGAKPSEPDQFIRAYFAAINQKQLELTWSWLSTGFKERFHCCDSNDNFEYQPYYDWWNNSVDRVEILEIRVQEHSANTARVYTLMRYYYNNRGPVDDQQIFHLVSDNNGSWLIDNQGG